MFKEYVRRAKELLALEYGCNPADFDRQENIITVSQLHEGRRVYSSEKYFFHMATFGNGCVITADEKMHGFLKEYVKGKLGHWLFELPNLLPIEKKLNEFGYTLSQTAHIYLPCKDVLPEKDYPVKWFYDSDIMQFYKDKRFPNAICESYNENRPDRIVVCAYDGENIMGMAGCSEDTAHWQQIGIDVIEKYRSQGVGKYLVTLLKNEIIRRGDIPFYGTAVANYHSQRIALACGFKPAWIEIDAKKKKE